MLSPNVELELDAAVSRMRDENLFVLALLRRHSGVFHYRNIAITPT